MGYWLHFEPGILKNGHFEDKKRDEFDMFYVHISYVNSQKIIKPVGGIIHKFMVSYWLNFEPGIWKKDSLVGEQ